jgi:hypothetical protein
MTAARYDLTIDQGADFALELTVKENGTAKDLSATGAKDWAVRGTYRKTYEEATGYNFTGTVKTPADGVITVQQAFNSNTSAPAGTYVYDVELYQHASGDTSTMYQVIRLLQGNVNLRREITR